MFHTQTKWYQTLKCSPDIILTKYFEQIIKPHRMVASYIQAINFN